MGNKLYKFEIDAGTVNKINSLLLPLDSKKGAGFRIEKAWISVRDLDAIVATDAIGFQLTSNVDKKGGDLTDFEELHSQYEIYTECYDFHLAEAAIVDLIDPQIVMPLRDIIGTILDCSEKNYANAIITGQDGALPMQVKFLGQYVNKGQDDFKYNVF